MSVGLDRGNLSPSPRNECGTLTESRGARLRQIKPRHQGNYEDTTSVERQFHRVGGRRRKARMGLLGRDHETMAAEELHVARERDARLERHAVGANAAGL